VLVYPVYVGDDKSDRERHMFRCDVCGYFENKRVKYHYPVFLRLPISMMAIPATITMRPISLVMSIGRFAMLNNPN
jgi:hypothetical protein